MKLAGEDSLVSLIVENEPLETLPKTGLKTGLSPILASILISSGALLQRRSSDEKKH